MGGIRISIYFNPNNEKFLEAIHSKIYVDKTGIITYLNSVIKTKQKYVCVSRPRRFGKTIAAETLSAYYSRGCDSLNLFTDFEIAKDPSFEIHLNRYNVIFLDMQEFLSESESIGQMIKSIKSEVTEELLIQYPEANSPRFVKVLQKAYSLSGIPFIFIVDEWDCVFREFKEDKKAQDKYLDFLRSILKDKVYVGLAYMTGILPIKKYGNHSALNMFDEFTMTDPGLLTRFVGFTEEEVKGLCECHQIDFQEMSDWYNGYRFPNVSWVYSPRSVVQAVGQRSFGNYWTRTESYEALQIYIEINLDGLRDIVIQLFTGAKQRIDVRGFTNDMVTFQTSDDVLTLLVHLGYLGYDVETREVFIPNKEIFDEFYTAIRTTGWELVMQALKVSDDLLNATWRKDTNAVALYVDKAHDETSHLTYNDENALSYVVSLAYYSARQYYNIHREMPAGKGFADLVFLPRKKYWDKPVIVVELKWDETAQSAVTQIEKKQYADVLRDYYGTILLVGINYNKKTKQHSCVIKELNSRGV